MNIRVPHSSNVKLLLPVLYTPRPIQSLPVDRAI